MKKLILAALLLLCSAAVSNATLVTSLPSGDVVTVPNFEYFGSGPLTIVPGISVTSTHNQSVIGYTNRYSFASNGNWNGLNMVGLNASNGTMTFAFDAPLNAVGGFLNYAPGVGPSPTISVFDSSMNMLDSATLGFNTGGGNNSGVFYGFQESNNISYFTISDRYIGLANLTVESGSAPVPEPGTMMLLGLGMAGLAIYGKRRKNSKA